MFLLGVDLTREADGAPHKSIDFITAFHDCMFYTMLRMIWGRAWELLPHQKYRKACSITHQYADYYIDQALSGNAETTKTRSLLTNMSRQTDDRLYIRNQVLQGMMASQETTSSLIANACLCLSRNPQYWEQIRTLARDPQNADLSFDAVAGLQPVRHIVLEALRLFPVFPIMGRTALCDTKLPVGGGPNQDQPVFAPKGTTVTMSWYALHRDARVFGDDADQFRPERWETIKPSPSEWMGFGGGNRACMGQQKVLAEAAFVLLKLAGRFERIESRDDRPWVGELKMTCKNKNGCKVAFFE
jgi:cytochrome P450